MDLLLTHGFFLGEILKGLQIMKPYATRDSLPRIAFAGAKL